jgi:hypothetical protein
MIKGVGRRVFCFLNWCSGEFGRLFCPRTWKSDIELMVIFAFLECDNLVLLVVNKFSTLALAKVMEWQGANAVPGGSRLVLLEKGSSGLLEVQRG